MQKLRYKKLSNTAPDLMLPDVGNAGFDIKADLKGQSEIILPAEKWVSVSCGIALEIPEGYVALARGRSGLAFNSKVFPFHGTIDSNYRGEIKALLRYEPNAQLSFFETADSDFYTIRHGDKILQLVIVPYFIAEQVELVDELSESNRGVNGFGSTGK